MGRGSLATDTHGDCLKMLFLTVNPKEEDLEYTEVQIIQLEDNGNGTFLERDSGCK